MKAREVKNVKNVVKEEVKEEIKAVNDTAEKETAVKAEKAVKAKANTVKKAVKESVAADEIILQISGKEEINLQKVAEACKADYKSKGHRMPKAVTVYVKPEEGVAYYTVNGKGSEDYKVEL
ncbi:MAG: DUF6465 family protein [Hominimerdicola sp.]